MDNGGTTPGNATTVPNPIPFHHHAAARSRLDQSPASAPIRLTRRGQMVRSVIITILVIIIALVAGLFAGGISGLI
jgi:hypothetical protein